MSLRPGEVFAGFTVERELGSGGMGSVYLVRHPRLPRHDALKLLRAELCSDPGFVGRFEREADTVAMLDHPNIVSVHDRGSQDGQLWISMRFIDGTNAQEALAAHEKATGEHGMPPDRVVRIVSKVASALDYAHRHGLLHRDVKPANILLTDGGEDEETERVFLSDFGVAKAIGEAAEQISSLTSTGSVVATLDYASPEQIKGQILDHRSDIYALGCVLYKLLTGTVPFPGESVAARVYGHLNKEPPNPAVLVPTLPQGFDAVVAKAMAKEPEERYSTCRQLAAAATAALTSPVAAIPAPVSPAADELATTVTPADLSAASRTPQQAASPQSSGEIGQPTGPSRPAVAGPPAPNPRRSRLLLIAGSVAALVAAGSIATFIWQGNVAGTPSAASSTGTALSTTASSTTAAESSTISAGPPTNLIPPVPGLPHSEPLPDDVLIGSRLVDGASNLYQIDAETGALGKQLTTGSPGTQFPLLSPDRGSMIYLQTSGAGNALRTAAVDGTEDRSLFDSLPAECGNISRPAWNPIRQSELALPCTTADGTVAVHRVSVAGDDLGTIVTGFPVVDDLAFSPDGETLVYWAAQTAGVEGKLYIQPLDGGSPTLLVDPGSGATDADPTWSPFGDKIVFRRLSQNQAGAAVAQLMVVNEDGSGLVPITD
ncbi:MAG: protein kinase, partial [Nakamurella sp.]